MTDRQQLEKHDDQRTDLGVFGMNVFLVSLSVMFTASIVIYLIIRARADIWPPPGVEIPSGLWLSTVVLLLSSGAMQYAVYSARTQKAAKLRAGMLITTVLGGLFLLSQGVVWFLLAMSGVTMGTNLYAFSFYVLTILHGLHVLGGLVYLGLVTMWIFQGAYKETAYPAVKYCSIYWHFLDVVWLVMFTVLFLIG